MTSTQKLRERPARFRAYALCAALLILAVTGLRLWAAGQLDVALEEAYYWEWSRNPDLAYYSNGPGIALLIRAFTRVFGDTVLGVRLGAFTVNALAQGMLFCWLGCLLNRPRLGLITLGILNTAPLFIAGGFLMTTDAPLSLCWVAAMTALTASVERPGKLWPFILLATALCLGLLTKYTMIFILPLAIGYGALLWRRSLLPAGWFVRFWPAAGAGLILGLAPSFVWNLQHQFVSVKYLLGLMQTGLDSDSQSFLLSFRHFPEYLGTQFLLLLPWWLAFAIWQGISGIRRVSEARAAIARSSGGEAKTGLRFDLLLLIGFWPIFLFFLLWSFYSRVYPNWSAMCYVAGVVLAAVGAENILVSPGRLSQRPWLALWGILSIACCVVMYGQRMLSDVLPLPDNLNPAFRLKGWSGLGERLEGIRKTMPRPDKVFFIADSYDVAASLAFNLPGQPVVYCADFERKLNQYDLWAAPDGDNILTYKSVEDNPDRTLADAEKITLTGWDAIFVRRLPMRRVPDRLALMFEEVADPEHYDSTHYGHRGRRFDMVRLYNFSGLWPRPSRDDY